MAESNIASCSGSDKKRKQNLDDSVDEDDLEVQSLYPDPSESDDSEDDLVNEKEGHYNTAEWFISDEIDPDSITKKPSSAKYVLSCFGNPSWRLDASKVKDQVLRIHEECAKKAKKYFQDFQGHITLSYEAMHVGPGETKQFLKDSILYADSIFIAAHFIDDNWKVRKWILLYTTDMAKKPLELFRTVCDNFNIGNKVSTIILPSDEIFDDKTVEAIRTFIDMVIPPPVFQIHCCADLFQLMAYDLHSSLGLSLLDYFRRFFRWPTGTSMNWADMWSNMERILGMKAQHAFTNDRFYRHCVPPSDEEIEKITTCWKLSDCIYEVATVLLDGHYSTANVYFHLLAELKVMLKHEIGKAHKDDFRNLGKQIMERLDKYWNDMFLVLATASVLDPRFKMKSVDFYCSKMNDESSNAETALAYLRNLYDCYASTKGYQIPKCLEKNDDEEDDSEEDDPRKEKKEGQDKRHKEAYKDFVLFQEFLKFEGSSVVSQESATELDSYLKEPVMEWDHDFKVLEWWKEESQKYPILSRVARDVLAIPISRATMSEAYAMDKREPPEFVLSLDPAVANAMLCSKNWLRL